MSQERKKTLPQLQDALPQFENPVKEIIERGCLFTTLIFANLGGHDRWSIHFQTLDAHSVRVDLLSTYFVEVLCSIL